MHVVASRKDLEKKPSKDGKTTVSQAQWWPPANLLYGRMLKKCLGNYVVETISRFKKKHIGKQKREQQQCQAATLLVLLKGPQWHLKAKKMLWWWEGSRLSSGCWTSFSYWRNKPEIVETEEAAIPTQDQNTVKPDDAAVPEHLWKKHLCLRQTQNGVTTRIDFAWNVCWWRGLSYDIGSPLFGEKWRTGLKLDIQRSTKTG